jgi:hypothetical protein
MTREILPQRRQQWTREIRWPPGRGPEIQVSVGFFADGRPAEVFITGAKAGSEVQAMGRDTAIIISMALQHGVPLEAIADALTRDDEKGERPASLIGIVVDLLVEESAK